MHRRASVQLKYMDKAFQKDPNNPDVLDFYGEVLLEYSNEDVEKAVQLFKRSVELAPAINGSKYFYLGQLSEGSDSLQYFMKAAQILENELQDAEVEGEEVRSVVEARLISAMCAIGELYMTDMCDEADAEENCKKYLEGAVSRAPQSVEALSGLAVYYKVIQDFDKTKELCKRALEIIRSVGEEDPESLPPMPIRLQLAKTLTDIDASDEAIEVLHQLLDEDENEVEVWYVLACAHMTAAAAAAALKGDAEATDRTEPLRIASECVSHALDLIKRQPEDAQWSEPLQHLGAELDKRKQKHGSSDDDVQMN
ncbi:hypothetical protein, conserved [Perkinsus marinus ATCC 50983]|uniref:Uncharacterized protein n=1 Tax=Perkinsus marinus (strain ATCC 50983 / TXsc) TaxID=423536 RepID=C5LBC4_PERM5|nr:hypothetical protein, conserved [Perkinsus marinus ATCC 50983]EER06052.1 hypothetical protein, conserved [Perkinsus marinus ATCC 50983]|eukprot:XP_002774236.1 hypothetical protein, conserved [Perkinsus marinus ATCC 50983]